MTNQEIQKLPYWYKCDTSPWTQSNIGHSVFAEAKSMEELKEKIAAYHKTYTSHTISLTDPSKKKSKRILLT